MRAYLDASVIVALLTGEASAEVVGRWLDKTVGQVIVSDFGRGEFVSALSGKCRGRLVPRADINSFLAAAETWFAERSLVRLESSDIASATDCLLDFDIPLRLPDALHIVIAARSKATLVSLDRQQIRAAVALGVHAVDPVTVIRESDIP